MILNLGYNTLMSETRGLNPNLDINIPSIVSERSEDQLEVKPEYPIVSVAAEKAHQELLKMGEEKGRKEAKKYFGDQLEKVQKRAEEAEKNSITDSLTGLYNRRYIDDYIKNFDNARVKKPLAVIFCDADNLGAVNKEKGDAAGDQLIRDVASAVETSVRREDKVARKGGDELVVLIEDFSNFEELKKEVSTRLKSKQTSDVKFSFGIVEYDQNKDNSLSNTIQRANDQMKEDYPNKKIPKH